MTKSKQLPIIHICKRKKAVFKNHEKKTSFSSIFSLPDVGEEAVINYNGTEVAINVNMLNDIRKLGFGNYGSVMLVEVDKHPEIRMAVKVKSNDQKKFKFHL